MKIGIINASTATNHYIILDNYTVNAIDSGKAKCHIVANCKYTIFVDKKNTFLYSSNGVRSNRIIYSKIFTNRKYSSPGYRNERYSISLESLSFYIIAIKQKTCNQILKGRNN